MLVFDGVTALDVVGPFEVLDRMPGASVTLVAKEPGLKRTHGGNLGISADVALADMPRPDVVVVPGGIGEQRVRADDDTLDWLREAHGHAAWTASVCTGALILGAAGLLEGRRATTYWLALDHLTRFGATPVDDERVVIDGKVMTSAGVSAGIDLALELAAELEGDLVAQRIQLAIEYDPDPPFDAGSPDTAPEYLIELLRSTSRFRDHA